MKKFEIRNSKLDIPRFQKNLLRWYRKHKRDLPWRQTNDPYKIWISEIMLQQTTVAAVVAYYHRFLKRFPDLRSLAEATEEEVLALWSGLGYYSRAKNIHRSARKILVEHAGIFPKDPEKIAALPGIGRYTLGAVGSIAFGLPLPVVDGNVIRVYARLFALKGDPKDSKFQKQIWEVATSHLSSRSPGDFNQALMELGATICTPQKPLCLLCPVQGSCEGRLKGAEGFPERKKRAETKTLKRIAAVIESEGRVLLTLSEKHRWMKGLWQLPSLFAENGESPETLTRKLIRGLGLSPAEVAPLPTYVHAITHHRITILPFRIHLKKAGRGAQSSEGREPFEQKKWFLKAQIPQIALPSADRKILNCLPTF